MRSERFNFPNATGEQLAATLDLPLGTVKTYIHRARHQLRESLDHLRDQ